MRIEENELGGESVVLRPGDDLSGVPASHRQLLTPDVRKAFRDPVTCFGDLAAMCRFPRMREWLNLLLIEGRWELHLHTTYSDEMHIAGFDWKSDRARGGTIELPSRSDLRDYPDELRHYYSIVSAVLWNGFGCAGGLDGPTDHNPLTVFDFEYHGADVDNGGTFVWGSSPCGDMIIYTSDGGAGWLCHETGHIYLLGTIRDALDWVFGELLERRTPEYDHGWA